VGFYSSLSNGSDIKKSESWSSESTLNFKGFIDLLKGEKKEGEKMELPYSSFPFVGGGLGRSD
jgi:hypothetical protein